MYPDKIIFDLDLYSIFLCIGILSAMITARVFLSKKKASWKLQRFCVLSGVVSAVSGYFSAVFFQALYNIEERGAFIIDKSTGATFYGGLIGGVLSFMLVYFGVGYFLFKKDKQHIKFIFTIIDIAAASISVAHACGRLGCLMGGCCYGQILPDDAWYGIYMKNLEAKVVPLQLYEALFLFALFAFFIFRLSKNKGYNLPIYMIAYGIWRFVIEFFRADERGDTIVSFLSPSQLIALLMVVGSAAVILSIYFGEKAVSKIPTPQSANGTSQKEIPSKEKSDEK